MAEQLNTYEEQDNTPQGHNEAMMGKVDEVQQFLADREKGDQPEEPKEKIAGKFESVEDLEQAYKELERKLGQQQSKPKEEATEKSADDQAQEAVEKAGLNMEDMSNYYYSNGELSDDHYSALEKAGIPREYVDAYIDGIEAQMGQAQGQIMEQVGGQEQYQEMTAWAKDNMSEREIERYNRAIDTGDPDIMEQAVMGLAYRYSKEVGTSPKLLGGEGKGTSGAFESVAQLTAAMSDPRYEKDPAYRNQVQQKLSRSNIL